MSYDYKVGECVHFLIAEGKAVLPFDKGEKVEQNYINYLENQCDTLLKMYNKETSKAHDEPAKKSFVKCESWDQHKAIFVVKDV